jgi:uncharacterized membrane protein
LEKLRYMRNLSAIGRIFYGISMAAMGVRTIYYKDLPYMLIPPEHSWLSSQAIAVYTAGALLLLSGAGIVFDKMTRPISLLLGTALLLVFCFYFVPYELLVSPNSMHFGAWENAAKELSLASGAFVVAGCYPDRSENSFYRLLQRLTPLGPILFSLTIISFSFDHFIYGKEAADYVPAWIPNHVFWIYFAGVALFGSGLGILLKIRRGLMATLLGTMILIWVVILHIPKVIAAHADDSSGEVTSAFLALAYCGIAFVIAGVPIYKTRQTPNTIYARQ